MTTVYKILRLTCSITLRCGPAMPGTHPTRLRTRTRRIMPQTSMSITQPVTTPAFRQWAVALDMNCLLYTSQTGFLQCARPLQVRLRGFQGLRRQPQALFRQRHAMIGAGDRGDQSQFGAPPVFLAHLPAEFRRAHRAARCAEIVNHLVHAHLRLEVVHRTRTV